MRERHLESLIHSSLRHVILVQNHPRTLIQVTLQISSTPENASTTSQSSQYSSVYFSPGSFALYNADDYVQSLPLIPSLLQTALLALLSASIPLSVTFTATILAVSPSSKLIQDPSPTLLREATSIHVLAFSSHGELLLAESEGDFGIETWEKVYHEAERICRGENEDSEEDVSMRKEDGEGLEGFLKDVVREKVGRDMKWKDGTI